MTRCVALQNCISTQTDSDKMTTTACATTVARGIGADVRIYRHTATRRLDYMVPPNPTQDGQIGRPNRP